MSCPHLHPQPLAAREPRRAATRARHLCRGRGGRGCRCHIAARPVVAHDAHPLRWHAGQEAAQPLALNRQHPKRLAINRIQQPSEQAIEQLTDEAMSDWVEVGGEDFMNPLIELAKTATSFEEFNAGLLTLQETLGADTFTPQLADYLFRMRGMGDAQDA